MCTAYRHYKTRATPDSDIGSAAARFAEHSDVILLFFDPEKPGLKGAFALRPPVLTSRIILCLHYAICPVLTC